MKYFNLAAHMRGLENEEEAASEDGADVDDSATLKRLKVHTHGGLGGFVNGAFGENLLGKASVGDLAAARNVGSAPSSVNALLGNMAGTPKSTATTDSSMSSLDISFPESDGLKKMGVVKVAACPLSKNVEQNRRECVLHCVVCV